MNKSPPVSFQLKKQEQVIAASLAAVTLWVNVLTLQQGHGAWLLGFIALFMAGWMRASPARSTEHMALRASLLLVASFFWPLLPEIHRIDSIYFFWPLLLICLYALLLPWFMSAFMLISALSGLIAMQLTLVGLDSWSIHTTLNLSFLFMSGLIFIKFGYWVQSTDGRFQQAMTDRRTQLYNDTGFINFGEDMLLETREQRKPLTLVVLNCRELREIPEIMGRKAAQQMLLRLVSAIQKAAPPGSLLARTGATEFVILIPGMSAQVAEDHLTNCWGQPAKITLKTKEYTVPIGIEVLVAQPSGKLESLEILYKRVHEEAERLRHIPEADFKDASDPPSSLMSLAEDYRAFPVASDKQTPLKFRYGYSVTPEEKGQEGRQRRPTGQ